jgi:hypothetical protein
MGKLISPFAQELAAERRRARAAAKLFAEACATGDPEKLAGAVNVIEHSLDGWTLAFREVARLPKVDGRIKDWFQLHWFESRACAYCEDKRAQLDALRVLFPRYRGPAVRLFRGADAREARLRNRLYGASWSASIEEADWFAREYQCRPNGSVVLDTLASAAAIIFAPAIKGPHWEKLDGIRLYDEKEYLVDGRRLRTVTVARRYPHLSFERWVKEHRGTEPPARSDVNPVSSS